MNDFDHVVIKLEGERRDDNDELRLQVNNEDGDDYNYRNISDQSTTFDSNSFKVDCSYSNNQPLTS